MTIAANERTGELSANLISSIVVQNEPVAAATAAVGIGAKL